MIRPGDPPAGAAVVVVGGGPAGLAAAYRLAAAGRKVRLVEQAPEFGGLARTISWPSRSVPGLEWRADIGVHRLHHATAPEVLADLRAMLGADLLTRPRAGLIFLEGREIRYPFSIGGVLKGLAPATAWHCGWDAMQAALRPRRGGPPESYSGVVEARFGKALNRIFYAPYARKVWGLDPTELSAVQAAKRIKTGGIGSLLLKAFGARTPKFYYYPRQGYGQMAAAYERALRGMPVCKLQESTTVAEVKIRGGRVGPVVLRSRDGAEEEVPCSDLLWTGSMESLGAVLPGDAAPVPEARLDWRAGHILYVGLDTPSVGAADAYYFPTTDVPFNRVSDQKKFSASLVPGDKTLLCLDFTDAHGARRSAEELFAMAQPHMERHGLLKGRVLDIHAVSADYVYPIYRRGYEADVARRRDWARALANLWIFGRQGLFLHNNIHHSLEMGYRVARRVAEGGDRVAWERDLDEFDTFQVED